MPIALAHDWLCGYRGGEAVLEAIARHVIAHHEPAGLYVMVDDGRQLAPTIDSLPKTHANIQRLPGAATRLRRWYLPLYPAAVRSLSHKLARHHHERPIDLLISTSSAAIKGLRPPEGVPHLCYCHAPARYIWSQTAQYRAGPTGLARVAGLRAIRHQFQNWDRRTATNVTTFLANSTHTQREIQRCFARDSHVVHPPVRTAYFTPDHRLTNPPPPEAPWLVVSALEPYKRVDLAIEAARIAGHELIICGTGSQARHLEAGAPDHVQFLGRVRDDQLREFFRTSSLLLFPQIEDFGIVAVEAQAAGCPVVARRAGGALDSVIDGETGTFFDDPTPHAIIEATTRVPTDAAQACVNNAARFSEAAFEQSLAKHIADTRRLAAGETRGTRVKPAGHASSPRET